MRCAYLLLHAGAFGGDAGQSEGFVAKQKKNAGYYVMWSEKGTRGAHMGTESEEAGGVDRRGVARCRKKSACQYVKYCRFAGLVKMGEKSSKSFVDLLLFCISPLTVYSIFYRQ